MGVERVLARAASMRFGGSKHPPDRPKSFVAYDERSRYAAPKNTSPINHNPIPFCAIRWKYRPLPQPTSPIIAQKCDVHRNFLNRFVISTPHQRRKQTTDDWRSEQGARC